MAPSIPTETLPAIFTNLNLFDLVRVSLVSQSWRSICLDTPSLWTDIDTAGCKKSFLDAIAVRSGTLPLSIESNTQDLFPRSRNYRLSMADALESVSEEHIMLVYLPRLMPRVKGLFLFNFNHTLGFVLRNPAPVLKDLMLRAGAGHLCDGAFRGQSGPPPSFPALKKLGLSGVTFCGGFGLCQLLAVCPILEDLIFEFPDIEPPPDVRILPGKITTYAPRLRKVVLIGEARETGPNIALVNSVPNLYIDIPFDVDVSHPHESSALVCALFGRRPSNFSATSLEVTDILEVKMESDSKTLTRKTTLRTQTGPCNPTAYLCLFTRFGLFDSLAQMRLDLSVCGSAFLPDGVDFPPAPSLQKLLLENCAPHLARLAQRRGGLWACPILMSLLLLGGECACGSCLANTGRAHHDGAVGKDSVIHVSTLCAFLGRVFGFSQKEPLLMLDLNGIELEGIDSTSKSSSVHGLPVLMLNAFDSDSDSDSDA
ncbi:hypothetical protein EXIGLDRAFT_781030 [Exidia glandulosa HHB12029]|uniref:F-box domain-containing protein n=1 Tax=Exidia glandulosa HHB12029 TaxID=1314781 RepID=A0A165BDM8_EXIGL|nr:hypothetical protein EXIGLDRAFT_781030 [Exidia glandulosa HHB12029]